MDRVYAPWRSEYFSMAKDGGCLFCGVQKEEDDEKVGILKRGKHWFIILNTFPYTSGHIMIVAREHINGIGEIGEEAGIELISLLSRAEEAIDESYRPDGINIGVNRGQAAGAGIEGHLHFHVVPRWSGDTNFMTSIAETRIVSEELGDCYSKLRPFFEE